MTATTAALCTLAALLVCVASSSAVDLSWCEAAARTHAGWACGVRRRASSGDEYASFLGVPYAKQPIGELRFQELQQLDPWSDALNATTEGPICPQTDVLYKQLMQAKGGMSEACIHANIHVPCEALPDTNDYEEDTYEDEGAKSGLPIFVFIHGGGFAFGSGDTDLHGPEYLVSKGVIVVTFNYRLNVFGFLSLNTTSVPGNNGLRDAITLLSWLQRNAKFFGGNPDDVTIAGQSAGAVLTHLLTLSPAAEGLFKRAMIMSGTGPTEFYSSSPQFAKQIADMFLAAAGMDPALDADELHARLVDTPLDTLMSANKVLIDFFGLTTFVPVVESPHPGVTAILDEDPEVMMERGNGKNIPLIIGFTDAECETFRPRFEEIDIAAKITALPLLVVPPRLTYQFPLAMWPLLIKAINSRYFNGTNVVDDFVNLCTDAYYKYPALRLAEKRAAIGGAPTYLYKFSYGGQHSVFKEAFNLSFKGAGHVEDLTYLFRVNSFLGPVGDEPLKTDEDDEMTDQMTGYVVNFMRYSVPMPSPTRQSAWPPAGARLQYRAIAGARSRMRAPSERELDMKRFFDALHASARD